MDIAGALPQRIPRELGKFGRILGASLTVKLLGLVGIFIALPIILYGQFEQVDRQTRSVVTASMQHQNWLVAQALTPMLDRPERPPHRSLNGELARFAAPGTRLSLLFNPTGGDASAFYYVASTVVASELELTTELESLNRNGVLQRLVETCTWDKPIDISFAQPAGGADILTSITPVQSRWGCWALVSSQNAADLLQTTFGKPLWQRREMELAGAVYAVLALFMIGIAFSVWRTLHRFGRVGRETRQGRIAENAFSSRNVVPELASVASDFDALVSDLHRVARDIRQTAEDNAHSFKAPLATIQASLDRVKRAVPATDERGQRATSLIGMALERLCALVNAAQRLDYNTADLIAAPRGKIDLTKLVGEVLLRQRDLATGTRIRLTRRLDANVMVQGSREVLDVAIENILDNAISFSPPDGAIAVTLTANADRADLRIEDEGPGIDPDKIERIFNRYFSLRPRSAAAGQAADGSDSQAPDHAGLGLWIVKRNVEALGGTVAATNRPGGGLCVRISLPLAHSARPANTL